MTAVDTWDVLCTLDGFASYDEPGDCSGYWGKQGPEFLDRRLAQYQTELRLVFGANTFRQLLEFQAVGIPEFDDDPVNFRLRNAPTTVVSSTLEAPLNSPDATLENGDAVEVVSRLKQESDPTWATRWG